MVALWQTFGTTTVFTVSSVCLGTITRLGNRPSPQPPISRAQSSADDRDLAMGVTYCADWLSLGVDFQRPIRRCQ